MRLTTLEVIPISGNPYGTHQGWAVRFNGETIKKFNYKEEAKTYARNVAKDREQRPSELKIRDRDGKLLRTNQYD